MAIHTIDSRRSEADGHYDRLIQRGVEPGTAKALLPALVSSNARLRQRAEAFVNEHGVVGHDLSAEGQRHAQAVSNAARQFVADAMEAGEFAGEPMFRPGNRYDAPEADLHDALDARMPQMRYPEAEANARRLALSEAEAKLPYGHRLDDEGNVLDGAGQKTGQTVRLPEPGKVVVRDGLVQNAPQQRSASLGGNGDGTTHFSKAEAGEWESGANRPFFADAD